MGSLRFNRYQFSRTILRKFAFLADDHGFKRRDLGAADEFVDRYLGEEIAVTITLSYPELPLVVLAIRVPTNSAYRYRGMPDGHAARLEARYYTRLKKNPTPHQVLQVMQEEFADIVARDVKAVVLRLTTNPRARLGQRWALVSHRFPS